MLEAVGRSFPSFLGIWPVASRLLNIFDSNVQYNSTTRLLAGGQQFIRLFQKQWPQLSSDSLEAYNFTKSGSSQISFRPVKRRIYPSDFWSNFNFGFYEPHSCFFFADKWSTLFGIPHLKAVLWPFAKEAAFKSSFTSGQRNGVMHAEYNVRIYRKTSPQHLWMIFIEPLRNGRVFRMQGENSGTKYVVRASSWVVRSYVIWLISK